MKNSKRNFLKRLVFRQRIRTDWEPPIFLSTECLGYKATETWSYSLTSEG
jgi:hypothetical protein